MRRPAIALAAAGARRRGRLRLRARRRSRTRRPSSPRASRAARSLSPRARHAPDAAADAAGADDERLPPRGSRRPRARVTAIGDSVLESADPGLRQVFPFLTVNADVGRQANEVFEEIAWLQLGSRLGPIVVIAGRVERHRRAGGARRPPDEALRPAPHRAVTVHAPRPWQDPNNSTLRRGGADARQHDRRGLARGRAGAPRVALPRRDARPPRVRRRVRARSSRAAGVRARAPRRAVGACGRCAGLPEAEDELRILGHQLGRPGRVERQLGLNVLDTRAPRARRGRSPRRSSARPGTPSRSASR